MAAHLAGAIAAQTTRPVLAVPLASSPLQGLDALLSSVQMPGGVPVATFAIGSAGAVNAALFAVSILAMERPALEEQLRARRAKKAAEVLNIELI
jgi:5-(carboxyamino)imidazole ribonucleotide mutase